MADFKKGIIAVLDLLGTKGVWKYSDPQKHIDNLKEFENGIDKIVKPMFDGLGKPNGSSHLVKEDAKFEMTRFSDTIIISFFFPTYSFPISEYETSYRLSLIFMSFAAELIAYGLYRHLFFRGSISYGAIYKDGEHIIGQAIDDAAQYADKANWIGISCTPSTSLRLSGTKALSTMEKVNDIIEYNVPHKNNTFRKIYCPNWPNQFNKRYNDPMKSLNELLIILSDNSIPEEAYEKYINTIDYFKYCLNIP